MSNKEVGTTFNPTKWFKNTNKDVAKPLEPGKSTPKAEGLSTISEKSDSQLGVSFKFGASMGRTVRTPGNLAGIKLFGNTHKDGGKASLAGRMLKSQHVKSRFDKASPHRVADIANAAHKLRVSWD